MSNIDRVAAGANNSVAIDTDGVVYVWGDNTYGQMGSWTKGSSSYKTYPVYTVRGASAGDNVDGALNDFIDIAITNTSISVLRKDGNVFSWGSNTYGQLGKGTNTESLAPAQAIRGESESSTAYLRNMIDISGGAYHVLALKDDNTVYSWGYNSDGQLGNNSTTDANSPIKVLVSEDGIVYSGLTGIANISAGYNSSTATALNGYLYTWGDGANYQLGNGTNSDMLTPTYVLRGESFYEDDAATLLE